MLCAQTYRDGVWYALWDDEEHTMNTQGDYETGDIFAPTTGELTVKWKYQWIDLVGAFRKIDTDVLESADGGNTTNTVGSFQENTDKNSNTIEHFTVSRNINWLKYNRSGAPTHKVIVYHQSLPLAKHILLSSGTYGTTTASLAFDDIDMLTVSAPKRVHLRSFLSAGDIKVTCSEPAVFRLGSAENTKGLTYAVGANACASANVGNIDDYAFDIYFAPQEDKTYQATVTITDGTSTATVTLSGKGLYVEPSDPPTPPTPEDSYYAYSAAICEGDVYSDELFHDLTLPGVYTDTIPNVAGADSIITFTLAVHPVYAFADSLTIDVGEPAAWQGIDLSLLPAGDTTLVASYQAETSCDSTYTLYLTVHPRITTYGNDTIELCHGDVAEYEGKTYRRSMVDSVLLGQANTFGGDSIVELVVIVYPEMEITQSKTIFEGTEQEWQGYDLSVYPVGDTTLVAEYTSVHGCDSTYVLHLTVVHNTEGFGTPDAYNEKTADKVLINGQLFIRKGEDYFDVLGHRL